MQLDEIFIIPSSLFQQTFHVMIKVIKLVSNCFLERGVAYAESKPSCWNL